MTGRKVLCAILAGCMLLCLASCARERETAEGTTSATAPESTIQKVSFDSMPRMDAPDLRIYPGNGVLLFEYVTPGMDSYDSTLISYSLTRDRVLGRLDLGNGVFSVQTDPEGGFSVFDASRLAVTYYSDDCREKKTVEITCVEGNASFLAPDDRGEKILVSQSRDGALYLVSPDGKRKTKVDLAPGYYEFLGCENGRFVLTRGANEVFVVDEDGSAREIFSRGGACLVNESFAAGRIGDHLVFMPLEQGDFLFTQVNDVEESLISAGKGVFLSRSAREDGTVLRLYRMANFVFAEKEISSPVAAAAVTKEGQIALVCREGEGFTYLLTSPADWEEKPFSADHDLSAVLDREVSLPALGSRDETDAFTEKIQKSHNVRFVYEECEMLSAIEESVVSVELSADRERILYVEKKLAEKFAFLPASVWKNIGNGLPFVVFLCESVPGNVGGVSFEFGGYNCIILEIGGVDSYFTYLFYHEVGHAISRRISKSDPRWEEEWRNLTPPAVLEAVEKGTLDGKNALTVEFTPDDPKGEICYVSAYARTNPEEDRAETLAFLFASYDKKEEKDLFSHKVLREKGAYWAKMIRAFFSLQSGEKIPFEAL